MKKLKEDFIATAFKLIDPRGKYLPLKLATF